MRQVSGFSAELDDAAEIIAEKLQQNALLMGIADTRLELWDHLVRQDQQDMDALPAIGNWYGARFDAAYRETQGRGSLYRNDLFVTIILHPSPRNRLLGGLAALFQRGEDYPQADEACVQEFDILLQRIDAGLARYGVRKLGVAVRNGFAFSEIAEAMHLIANGRFRPVGLSRSQLGRCIVSDRITFDRSEFLSMRGGSPHYGAMVSFQDYPAQTRPGMFHALRNMPFPVVVTSALAFRQRAEAAKDLDWRSRMMKSGEDAAKSQRAELEQAEDDLQSGRGAFVDHHWCCAVYAPAPEVLDRRVAQVQSALSDVGVNSARESVALLSAYYSQLPGNWCWRTRPGAITTLNVAGLAPRHNVPSGTYRGRWGAPVVSLRTTADTQFHFHFHVQDAPGFAAEDLGNCLLIGPSGSGKTALLGTLCLLSLRNPHARVVVVDRDFGLSVLIRAAGGAYLVLPNGSPSGLAPLRALGDTPEDREYLAGFVRKLILSDGLGPISSAEDTRIARAVRLQMRRPGAERSMAGIAVMLGMRNPEGAAARLRKWCQGGALGWAFDNDVDVLDFGRRIVGFDTTSLLRHELVASPTLSYLFYRVRGLINGQPLVVAIDEMWQADKNPEFAAENNEMLKTIRKNEGLMVLATQSARDALNSEIGHTYVQQVPTKIFFGDTSADPKDLQDGMHLSAAEYDVVAFRLPTMRFTFLVKRPHESVLCRLDLSAMPDKVAAVSGRRSTYGLMQRLIARHGDDPQAWVPEFERLAPDLAAEPTGELAVAAE